MNKKVKILIVEDNLIISLDLKFILESFGYEVVGSVISYEKAIDFLDNNPVDLVLLDIGLSSHKTGIDVADYINSNLKIPFIFLTSNSDLDTITEASKRKPHSYLVKPFNKDTIHASIELAVSEYNSDHKSNESLFIKKNNVFHKIRVKNLTYIKSDNIYLELYCKDNNRFVVRSTLKKFLEKLPENFTQCHKSYIINLDSVSSFSNKYAIINNNEIPISSKFKSIFNNLKV